MKKYIYDKKGGIGNTNAAINGTASHNDNQYPLENANLYLDNLAAAATQEKVVLDNLVSINTNLIAQLKTLTKKYKQLTIQEDKVASSNVPMLNGKKLKFVQFEKTVLAILTDIGARKVTLVLLILSQGQIIVKMLLVMTSKEDLSKIRIRSALTTKTRVFRYYLIILDYSSRIKNI